MPDLADGETFPMQGSGAKPYILKNTGGVYSCSCPAWRNQSITIEKRTCKHLRKLRGDAAEETRIGGALPQKPVKASNATGEASTEPPLLLAESWDNTADLCGWWMSEKLDRKKFQRTVSIVRRQDKSDLWKEVRFLVFDAPAAPGGFEDRFEFLKQTIAKHNLEYAKVHHHEACKDLPSLRRELARIESLGGEGLMLRKPGSKYEAGRSSTLLKVKSFLDADAIVIDHQPGAGKHKGRLGALLVRMPGGTEFAVGTGLSDKERESPPAIGTTITYRYQELSDAGVPRFPSYLRIRSD
jgi:DNA ligase 1